VPTYSVEGKLGTGKTKFCVWMAQLAMLEGRRVATNLDLRTEFLIPAKPAPYVRLPDKPSAFDLAALGHGNPESYDEERNGVLILDELGTWLNSRSFQDKGRAGVLDWLIHARKHGWTVFLIVQDIAMIDKQVRESLVEYQCRCMRADKVRVPLIGGLLAELGRVVGLKRLGYLPRFHMVTARVGNAPNQIIAERWKFRGDDLHRAYDTRQIFQSEYPHGVHSVLPAPPVPVRRSAVARALAGVREWVRGPGPVVRPALKPKRPEVVAAMALPADRRCSVLSACWRGGAAS